MTRLFISATLAGMFLLCSCDRSSPAPAVDAHPAGAVAKVGERWILEADVKFAIDSGRAIDRPSALEMLIEDELFAEMARLEKLDEDPSVRAAQRRMLASRYLESIPESTPTEAELKAAWEATPTSGRGWAKAAILRQRATPDLEAAVAKLEAARTEWLEAPEHGSLPHFGPLAVKYSDDADTRFQGGAIGRVTTGQPHLILPADLVDWATSRSGPSLSEVRVSGDSAWLILISEVGQPEKRPFEEVAPQLRNEWKLEAGQEARRKRSDEAAERVPVELFVDFSGEKTDKPEMSEPPGLDP